MREREVGPLLSDLGIDDIDPRGDDVTFAVAAALCESAGSVGLPYPLAAVLVLDDDGQPTAAVPAGSLRVDHGDLFPTWRVGRLCADPAASDGGTARPAGTGSGGRLGPFVVDLHPDGDGRAPSTEDLLVHQTLVVWTILGTLERAVELAVAHVNDRVQFGRPIAAFQAVQFQLADAAVGVAGLRELAGYTLWRIGVAGDAALVDVLAARLHSLEVARSVLRCSQQLHGAAGVCEEYDISVLVRSVQPALRLPYGVDRTASELVAAIRGGGFEGLFPHGQDRLDLRVSR